MTVLTLLKRPGCLPEGNSHVIAGITSRWQRSLQPGEEPCAELALLSAMEGDATTLWRHAEAARTPDGRATALYAAAAYLAGAPVTLTTASQTGDRVVRTCLALARASGDGSPPAKATARRIVRSLLRTDAWTDTIPLLPQLAPGALRHLSLIAGDQDRRTNGPEAPEATRPNPEQTGDNSARPPPALAAYGGTRSALKPCAAPRTRRDGPELLDVFGLETPMRNRPCGSLHSTMASVVNSWHDHRQWQYINSNHVRHHWTSRNPAPLTALPSEQQSN
jgi:hypothetical protein